MILTTMAKRRDDIMNSPSPRVLCVDDEPKNLRLLKAVLEPRGYDVLLAASGLEALKKIKTEQVDICLLDIMMPGINGYEVCRQIKSDDLYRNIPIVLITSYTSAEHRILGIEAGAEDFISKPFDRFEVLARIKMLLAVKSLNDQLNAAREYADRTLQMAMVSRIKSDFMANMSHELLTPLNVVIGFSTVLNKQEFGPFNDKQQEFLNYIISSGMHLQTMINDILAFTSSKKDSVELELSTFSLRELSDTTLTVHREKALEKEIGLYFELTPENDSDITADQAKLKHILANLISNALKFSPPGGTVRVTSMKNDSFILFTVSDTGIGIRKEDIPNLFQICTQLEPSNNKVYAGIGLGLVLSRQLVEEHGGKIWVESRFGTGSTFSFTIPQ